MYIPLNKIRNNLLHDLKLLLDIDLSPEENLKLVDLVQEALLQARFDDDDQEVG